MATRNKAIIIPIEGEEVHGTFLTPSWKVPGVLFVHGWGGQQHSDLTRARGIAGLGCVCLTFDMRGHASELAARRLATREDNLRDVIAAYDLLASHPAIDTSAIAVVGSSYGGYLSAILTSMRPVKWLALQVPALYRDEQWSTPKLHLDRDDLAAYRRTRLAPEQNRALRACSQFTGDVLIVESERDHLVPHQTVMNYRAAFQNTHSLTHRIVDGADHALSSEHCQQAYTSILVNWVTEMVVGARVGGPDIELPVY